MVLHEGQVRVEGLGLLRDRGEEQHLARAEPAAARPGARRGAPRTRPSARGRGASRRGRRRCGARRRRASSPARARRSGRGRAAPGRRGRGRAGRPAARDASCVGGGAEPAAVPPSSQPDPDAPASTAPLRARPARRAGTAPPRCIARMSRTESIRLYGLFGILLLVVDLPGVRVRQVLRPDRRHLDRIDLLRRATRDLRRVLHDEDAAVGADAGRGEAAAPADTEREQPGAPARIAPTGRTRAAGPLQHGSTRFRCSHPNSESEENQ